MIIRHQELGEKLLKNESVFDIICKERLILYSIKYNDCVILVDNLREAKMLAREYAKKNQTNVEVYHHSPFEPRVRYISIVYKGNNRLRYFYVHEDALIAKKY